MPSFRFDKHDGDFVGRTTIEDWARIIDFRGQPNFVDAVLLYGALMPGLFVNNFIINKVVPEAWRFQMLVFTLHLHDTRDTRQPASGLTLSNLQRICTAQGIAGPGRVAAFLNLMRLGGHLTRTRSLVDSRVVRLEPTATFIAIVERWNDAIFRILDTVDPGGAFAVKQAAHPRLSWEMRRGGAETLLVGWVPLALFPEVSHFLGRDGGWVLLTHCIAQVLQDGGSSTIAPVTLDLGAFGKQFGVSRSQLRRLLDAAHEIGLLDAPPHNGSNIVLSEVLVGAFLAWLASYLENFQRCTREALTALLPVGVEPVAVAQVNRRKR